ncbi:MAG: PP2C family protein-serine/threonine phosphatase [Candidatus Methanomethylophilaceae archaeon]|nr:PP2C family protein-serine/threonine phosphatase [Candidatus Methanomethylophilaceae archaeon]
MNAGLRTISFPGSEEKPNRTAALVCAALSVFLLAYVAMVRMNVIEDTNHSWTYASTLICSVILMSAVILYAVSDGKSWWVRYVLMSSIMITALIFCVIMTSSYLVFVLPMILCILYYNKEFSILMSVICGALMLLEPVLSYYADKVNLNYVDLIGEGNGTVMISGWGWDSIEFQLVNYTVPCMVIFISISMLAIWLTHSGFENIIRYNETALRKAAIDKELAIASDIQRGMLPGEIPGKGDFSISARMLTARSVGGDFYDFLKADDAHVALVIADVSGKGTPAALFMASAKSALRSNLANGLQPDMVMKKTNQILCDSKREKLFVTSWLGIIDLETGRMSYVNAGHNPPFLIRGGKAEKLIDPPNFILGRKKRAEYKEHRITLQPGDVLFLYTDGVTEAVGADKKMFGESRLQDLLSGAREDAGGIIETVDSEIRNSSETWRDRTT